MKKILYIFGAVCLLCLLPACSKSKSYSELLREEEKATNWFMANQRIIGEVPADSVFQTGKDAPFYKMDDEGYLYMQVINPGSPDKRAKQDQLIYFRYMRTNLNELYKGNDLGPSGNANNLNGSNQSSFRFNNYTLPSSSAWGSGVQMPLRYLGLDCEVNIVIRSYYGFTEEQGACQSFLYNIKYYPAQY